MRLFVSGKIGEEAEARRTMDQLEALGHQVTFDWTRIEHLKPYEANAEASADAAVLEVEGVKQADALVVIAHERGVGMYVELGVALGMGKHVYVVWPGSSRTMFFHHPLVKMVSSVADLPKPSTPARVRKEALARASPAPAIP